MRTPPVFEVAKASSEVTALLGVNPTRLWPFGEAPRDANGVPASATPYAVWQLSYGTPQNTLSCPPDIDNAGVQVDAYAKTAAQARAVANALSEAYEDAYHHVVSWNGEFMDDPTRLFRVSFTVEFWTPR